jgi:hypothetical protein
LFTPPRQSTELIGWTRQKLTDQSGIGLSTISDFGMARRTPHPSNFEAILGAFEKAGEEVYQWDKLGARVSRKND